MDRTPRSSGGNVSGGEPLILKGEVTGYDEAYQSIKHLADERKILNILRGGIVARARLARDLAKELAPQRAAEDRPEFVGRTNYPLTSTLRNTIRVTSRIRARDGGVAEMVGGLGKAITVSLRMGDRKKGVFYAWFVHKGTAEHPIPKNPYFRLRNHPGAQQNPFLRVALQKTNDSGKQVFKAYVEARLEKLRQSGQET